MPQAVQIKINVDTAGNCRAEYGTLRPIEAALILSQVLCSLQAQALQDAGGAVIVRPNINGPLQIS